MGRWRPRPWHRRFLANTAEALDPAAAALIAAMPTDPSGPRAVIINNLIQGLKVDGIWSLLDVLYVFAAHAEDAALLNWTNPATFVPAGVNSPTFTADQGFAGNGTTSYVRTNYTPQTHGVNYLQNNASVWVWSRTNAAAANASMIGGGTSVIASINPRNTSDQFAYRINDASSGVPANADSSGFLGASRTGASARGAWRNGVSLGTDTTASGGRANSEQWVCAFNTTSPQFTTRQAAAAAWGASLAGKEVAFYNRMLTYMQAVGAA